MKHYDGPAFFVKRGFQELLAKKKVTKQFKTPRLMTPKTSGRQIFLSGIRTMGMKHLHF